MKTACKYALLSVYNKDKVVDLANCLIQHNYVIISTGGTAKLLHKHGISVVEISKLTGVPEMLGGRIKTLNHKIHAGILAKRSQEAYKELEDLGIQFIDIVVANLYPFEEGLKNNLPPEEMIELIDIGGPTMIRAAAKNSKDVAVISDPEQYTDIIDELNTLQGNLSEKTKRTLAKKAFAKTAHYDALIHQYFCTLEAGTENLLETVHLNLNKVKDLRYGENPHQKAAFYTENDLKDLPYKVLQGKELSYNNIVDIASAMAILSEFADPTAVIIKHNNPCGAATGVTEKVAFENALNCDPVSAFGGIVGINGTIDKQLAKLLLEIFLEVIVARQFTEDALEILSKKKNLRLVEYDQDMKQEKLIFKAVPGGFLVQTADVLDFCKDDLKYMTERKPTEEELVDMLFAWKIVKNTTSNSIVIAKDRKTVGLGIGQTSRIGAVEIALKQACDQAKGASLASDGFFPAIDNIYAAQQSRISSIIQPGGSIKDKEVVEAANKASMAMVMTGYRHFKH